MAVVVQHPIKTYPMLKWGLIAGGLVLVVGTYMSKLLTDPDDANMTTFLVSLGIGVALPFLTLLMPRRDVLTIEAPTDHLAKADPKQVEGVLAQLDAARASGELPEERYQKARERILSQQPRKK